MKSLISGEKRSVSSSPVTVLSRSKWDDIYRVLRTVSDL